MRTHAAAFLRDVEARPDSPEAGVAQRAAGILRWFAGEYAQARDHLRKGARLVPARARRRSRLSLRTGPRRHRDGLSGDCVVASRRGRPRDFAHRPHASTGRAPHPRRHARIRKIACGHVRIDARRSGARRAERIRTRAARGSSTTCPCGERSACFSRVGRTPRAARSPAGSRTCAVASSSSANRTFCFSTGCSRSRWPRPKPGRANPTAPSRSSTKRWRRPTARDFARSKRNCIATRGEILLKRDPANPAPAEDAFLTAIAVAKQQAHAQLRTARRALARQTLPIDRPPRRRPRRPRARARRLFADAGNAGDRRGAGAAGGAGGD